MHPSYLTPAEAAHRLGVSAKALRLYEQRGLVTPGRTAAGWRSYGPDEIKRAAEVVALRALGLSLTQVGQVLTGDGQSLEPALVSHQAALESRIGRLAEVVQRIAALRLDIAKGGLPQANHLPKLLQERDQLPVTFELPWPWGGETFELPSIAALTFIIGPLGSGKTRLARRLAEVLPGTRYLGLDRLTDGVAARLLDDDSALREAVEHDIGWLIDEGATASDALVSLVVALRQASGPVVVDMVEDGLDHASQGATIRYLRLGASATRPLFLMTRSSAILDLGAVTAEEAILFCPANHNPPMLVAPFPGAPGYEAVAMCLATPAIRARTAGTVVLRPNQLARRVRDR